MASYIQPFHGFIVLALGSSAAAAACDPCIIYVNQTPTTSNYAQASVLVIPTDTHSHTRCTGYTLLVFAEISSRFSSHQALLSSPRWPQAAVYGCSQTLFCCLFEVIPCSCFCLRSSVSLVFQTITKVSSELLLARALITRHSCASLAPFCRRGLPGTASWCQYYRYIVVQ